jgi:hypothetical protein
MAQNFDKLSMEDARRLAQTEPGQRLISHLQSQNPRQLQAAMAQASAGDYEQLKKTLAAFMDTPEAQALLRQLENGNHE